MWVRPYGRHDPSAGRVNQPCVTVCIPAQWKHGAARGVEAFEEKGESLVFFFGVGGGGIFGVRGGKCAFSFPLLSLFVW